jgi:hypothetical protein
MFHVIPSDLLQSILSYLDTRPHGEVRRLIDGVIKNAKPTETTDETQSQAAD